MNWVDPWGLTQQDIERARAILKDLHPDLYNDAAKVTFGDTPGDAGRTDFFTGDVTISKQFEGELTVERRVYLLDTLAHEFQHSNQTLLERALTNIEDRLGVEKGRHYEIYMKAMNLSQEAYKRCE